MDRTPSRARARPPQLIALGVLLEIWARKPPTGFTRQVAQAPLFLLRILPAISLFISIHVPLSTMRVIGSLAYGSRRRGGVVSDIDARRGGRRIRVYLGGLRERARHPGEEDGMKELHKPVKENSLLLRP